MDVLVFRHGPAGDKKSWARSGRDDAKRPLTPEGRRKTAKAAAGLAKLVASLDVVAASPLTRAAQTADVLAARFKNARRVSLDELKPAAAPARAAARLLALKAGRVAAIGHEPQLSAIVAQLTGCPGLKLELKKAGACLLRLDRPGSARLVWLLKPSQLRGLR